MRRWIVTYRADKKSALATVEVMCATADGARAAMAGVEIVSVELAEDHAPESRPLKSGPRAV